MVRLEHPPHHDGVHRALRWDTMTCPEFHGIFFLSPQGVTFSKKNTVHFLE